MEKVGFIGLGIMGKPMALNLLKADFPLTVWNRTPEKMAPVVAQGAKAATSPKETAQNSTIIITMVTDTPDVEEVTLGKEGILEGAAKGSVVIDMSTISPTATREFAERLEAHGIEHLDAPVSGGDVGAAAGTLAAMVGGKAEVLERCRPVLEAMCKTITHVGGHGMGQTVKLCNQILVSLTNLAVCEAVTFAKAAGIDPTIMISAVQNGAAGSWQLTNLGIKMARRDFAPGFMIDLQQKDLRLALQAAEELSLPLPGLSLVHQLFLSCQAAGEGREGTQALIKAIERLAVRKMISPEN
ncbi:MAG: NAD(P)-dependent oxidoreductase [candidate division KSB1 bacterium]|nr:NAD(P)-dependent oxidoreductase [candidate division KSB1 bacterium]MDZ7346057.1 NAD(P)-dependent oxidoreductase [candidate division KSB1 bacterium]